MSHRPALGDFLATAVFAAAALFGAGARAQSPSALDDITAEALFDDGVRLMDAQNYTLACPKLQRSYDLDPGIGTLLYLGDCYRSLGKTASAWMAFRTAAFEAAKAGQRDREQAATTYAEAIHPQLVLLRLQAQTVESGSQILLDGHGLHVEVVDVPFAVDPGQHTLELSAPGFEPQRQLVELENVPGVVVVDLPELKPTPPPPAAPPPAPTKATPCIAETSTRDTVGWLLVGAGASALAVGSGLAVFSDTTRTGLGIAAIGGLSAGVGGLLLYRSPNSGVQLGFSAGRGGGTLVAEKAF